MAAPFELEKRNDIIHKQLPTRKRPRSVGDWKYNCQEENRLLKSALCGRWGRKQEPLTNSGRQLLQGPPRAASLDAKILNYANDDARQYIHYSIHIYEVVHASSSSLCQCLANRQPLPTSTLMPKGRSCELAASRLETSGRTVGPNDKNPPQN